MRKNEIKSYVAQHTEEMYNIIKELCLLPAPSHYEHKRAEYLRDYLINSGAKGVYIDEALNVIFPLNCDKSNKITVFAAHTDTVFPDTDPMPYFDDGEKIHSPGVADDTASVAVLITMAKYFIENEIVAKDGIMFVCNSCEEGLGNLKGTRQLFKDYDGRIDKFISFDSNINVIADRCVGSHRYKVDVYTEGGHSFGAFGNNNAIAEISNIVNEIYKINVPEKDGTKTTYNVGEISGGTSVNTIAQNATMLCEYRSDDKECLDIMQKNFESIFEGARCDKVSVEVTKVGDRPCSDIDFKKIDAIKEIAAPIIEDVIGEKVSFASSSTDCNIPLSLGVSAICIGVDMHQGIHTREEWVDKASLVSGLEVAVRLGCELIK